MQLFSAVRRRELECSARRCGGGQQIRKRQVRWVMQLAYGPERSTCSVVGVLREAVFDSEHHEVGCVELVRGELNRGDFGKK